MLHGGGHRENIRKTSAKICKNPILNRRAFKRVGENWRERERTYETCCACDSVQPTLGENHGEAFRHSMWWQTLRPSQLSQAAGPAKAPLWWCWTCGEAAALLIFSMFLLFYHCSEYQKSETEHVWAHETVPAVPLKKHPWRLVLHRPTMGMIPRITSIIPVTSQ